MDLIKLNPWWEHESAIEQDKHIRILNNFRYVYRSPLLDNDFMKGNLYTIRGPRQVGKTTFLKMFIRKLLKTVQKENIFYWSCDNLRTKNDLIDLIGEYADFCKTMKTEPEFILLDEITGIEDWQKGIKFLIDNDISGDACYILTGSNLIDLKKGSERLPGRRGKHGEDLYMLPLDFREYVGLIDEEWFKEHEMDDIDKLRYHSRKLKIYFERYLMTGGIPLVINEFEKIGEIPNYINELYYSWILGDILREGKNEQTFKELIGSVIVSYSTPVSWDSLGKRTSASSHVTIGSYIELLSNLFVIHPCYFYDINQRRAVHRKNKKLYFFDPFILRMLSQRMNLSVDKEKIIEGIVGSMLKRRIGLDEIYYTRVKKETDFVIPPATGIEVKCQGQIGKADRSNIGLFDNYLLITKDDFDEYTLPVHVFLFMDDLLRFF
jgi:hypothetical protein